MKSKSGIFKFILPAAALIFILSCDYDVPVNEMISAKTAIEEARMYDAEKYAGDELKKAESLLLQCHDLVAAGKADDAKKAALDSYTEAIKAQTQSLPQFASEKIKRSDEAFVEADKAYAEKFSPEKFSKAATSNADAKYAYEKKDYKKAAQSAIDGYKLAVEAKNESLKNSSVIEKELASSESRYAELKGDKYSSAAETNLASAGSSIEKAKSGVQGGDYKAALSEVESAKKELDAAAVLIRKQKIASSIQELRNTLVDIQRKGGNSDVKEDLDNAMLELNGAEAALEQNNITDAEMKVEQARKLIAGSDIKLKKKNAADAIEKAEKLLVQARGKDAEKKYSENLNKADSVIGQSKKSVEAEKYNEAISGAEEAETIINAVLNSMETDAAKVAVKSGDAEKKDDAVKDEKKTEEVKTEETTSDTAKSEEVKKEDSKDTSEAKKDERARTYVVQWRKKNTDCLWRISAKVYNDARLWPAIYLANRDQIKDPDLIFPGQKFIIPPKPRKRPHYKKGNEKTQSKTETKTDSKAEIKAETKTETKNEVKTETKSK